MQILLHLNSAALLRNLFSHRPQRHAHRPRSRAPPPPLYLHRLRFVLVLEVQSVRILFFLLPQPRQPSLLPTGAPVLYAFPELCAATNNFLAKRLPSTSSSVWRCSLRSRVVLVIQRPFRRQHGDMAAVLPARLAALCRSHHSSLARLLGASSADDHVYLVYEFVPGASLSDCLRNPQNPSFTPLASWISRVQVATDVAQGLEYIHHHSPASSVHNGITSSAIVVAEPDFRAKICYFGAADLTGEIPNPQDDPAEAISISSPSSATKRSGERQRHIKGTRGYMAPDVLSEGAIMRRSDVFAFGVVLLELLSGKEPLNYRYDRERKEFDVVSVIDTAREAVGGEDEEEIAEAEGRVRRWLDRRLKDSFPVGVAEKLIRVALRCVDAQSEARPDMTWVAGKISKLYLESKAWEGKAKVPSPDRLLGVHGSAVSVRKRNLVDVTVLAVTFYFSFSNLGFYIYSLDMKGFVIFLFFIIPLNSN